LQRERGSVCWLIVETLNCHWFVESLARLIGCLHHRDRRLLSIYWQHLGTQCFLLAKSLVDNLTLKLHVMDLLFHSSALDLVLVALNRSILCTLAFPSEEQTWMRHRILFILLPVRKLPIIKA